MLRCAITRGDRPIMPVSERDARRVNKTPALRCDQTPTILLDIFFGRSREILDSAALYSSDISFRISQDIANAGLTGKIFRNKEVAVRSPVPDPLFSAKRIFHL